jgi:Domain of unknown function (DUF4160)
MTVSSFRFFLHSLEGNEPAHIHVEHGSNIGKFWLAPVTPAESHAFVLLKSTVCVRSSSSTA